MRIRVTATMVTANSSHVKDIDQYDDEVNYGELSTIPLPINGTHYRSNIIEEEKCGIEHIHDLMLQRCEECESCDSNVSIGHCHMEIGCVKQLVQRQSVCGNGQLTYCGMKPILNEPNKFMLNQIVTDLCGKEYDGIEIEASFSNRPPHTEEYPISKSAHIICTTNNCNLYITEFPLNASNGITQIRPNDGFVVIHTNLEVIRPKSGITSNSFTLKFSKDDDGRLLILGEGTHLLLIDKNGTSDDGWDNAECNSVLLVGKGDYDGYIFKPTVESPENSREETDKKYLNQQSSHGPSSSSTSADKTQPFENKRENLDGEMIMESMNSYDKSALQLNCDSKKRPQNSIGTKNKKKKTFEEISDLIHVSPLYKKI